MTDPVFKSPPNFTKDDVGNVTSLVTKLNALALTIGVMIGTAGPNRGQTAWGAAVGGGGGSTTIIGGGGGTGGSTTPDLTPPPVPTNFAASAAISNIIVTCDPQTYTQGHGHLKSRLYGAIYSGTGPLPTFGGSVVIDEFTGNIEAVPENPATEWHLWLTWVTNDGVEGSPAGGTNGVSVTTGQDVSKLLAALNGQITQSQLFSALSTRIDLIDAPSGTAGSVNARILTETNARTAADSAISSTVTTLSSQVSANSSAIASEATTRANADTAEATARTTLQSVIQAGEGNICQNPGFVAGGGSWSTTTFLARNAGGVPVGAPSANVARFANRDAVMGVALPVQPGEVLDCSVWVASATTTTTDVGMIAFSYNAAGTDIAQYPALATTGPGITGWTLVSGTFTVPAGTYFIQPDLWINQAASGGTNTVYYANPTIHRRAGSGAINYAAIQTEAATRATVDGGLLAQYTVKVDVNGYVSGFGLASTTTGATPSSAFAVRADKFYIASPSGPGISPVTPFIVVTTPTTINGVAVPVGVYMDATYIENGTVTNAKIANLTVDDAKIANLAVSKLLAGSISVGQYIQSSNYVANSSGWHIDGNGNAEFSFAMIRGTLLASQISAGSIDVTKLDTRGLTVKDAAGTVILGVGAGQQGGNDSASALGFNPTWSAWSNGATYPDNWTAWAGSPPTRSTSSQGSPYAPTYSLTAGDVAANGRGMVMGYNFASALPAGTTFTGAFMVNVLSNGGGSGAPGYLFRLFTNSALTTFVDTPVPAIATGVSGWQRVPFTATANGSPIYGIQVYQMAGWSGMPGGMWSAGSSVSFGPLTFDINTPIGSNQLSSSVNADIADRLSKSVPSILSSTVSIDATTGAGFVAGNLTWDSTGNVTGGHGVAMTPGGLVGVNAGGVKTFSIDASTGNAYFAGKLASGTASTGVITGSGVASSANASGQVQILSSIISLLSVTTQGGDLLVNINCNAAVMCNTNTPVEMQLSVLVDGVLYGLGGDQPQAEFTLTNSNPMKLAAGSGATAYNWGATQPFDYSFIIPASDVPAGLHTISCQVSCHFWTASGTGNVITGSSLYARAKASCREFLA